MGMLVQNLELVEDHPSGKKTFRIHLDISLEDERLVAEVRSHLERREAEPLAEKLKPLVADECRAMVDAALVSLRPRP